MLFVKRNTHQVVVFEIVVGETVVTSPFTVYSSLGLLVHALVPLVHGLEHVLGRGKPW